MRWILAASMLVLAASAGSAAPLCDASYDGCLSLCVKQASMYQSPQERCMLACVQKRAHCAAIAKAADKAAAEKAAAANAAAAAASAEPASAAAPVPTASVVNIPSATELAVNESSAVTPAIPAASQFRWDRGAPFGAPLFRRAAQRPAPASPSIDYGAAQ
jgi:hypothetical protein